MSGLALYALKANKMNSTKKLRKHQNSIKIAPKIANESVLADNTQQLIDLLNHNLPPKNKMKSR